MIPLESVNHLHSDSIYVSQVFEVRPCMHASISFTTIKYYAFLST